MTAGEIFEQLMRDVVWAHFPKAFIDDDKNAETVKLSIPAYEKLPAKPRSFVEKQLIGKTIKFNKTVLLNTIGFPVSTIPLPAVFMEKDKAGNISNVSFNPLENELVMTWSEGDEVNSVHIGMDGEYRWSKIVLGQTPYNTCAIGAWNSENELEIHIRPIEAVAERVLIFTFNGENVTMQPSSNPTIQVMGESIKESVKGIIKQQAISNAFSNIIPHIVPLVDAKHRGKIK